MQQVVIPRRSYLATGFTASTPDAASDNIANVFALLARGFEEGHRGALITVVEVEGGSARGIGAQMAVLDDGRYCGYVSGGCLESAIAAEAMKWIARGEDAVLRFGIGSPFIDITLPCGGSIELHVHVDPAPEMIAEAAERLAQRQPFTIELTPATQSSDLRFPFDPTRRTGWHEETFTRVYAPKTRLLVIGRGLELEQTTRVAAAAGLDIVAFCADDDSATVARTIGAATTRLLTSSLFPALPIDPHTAVVFLFHDHEWETLLLKAALAANPFFIGALGSRHAHQARRKNLLEAGVALADIDRIKGPVGLFGPTRDAASLAISILAEVTERRLQFDRS